MTELQAEVYVDLRGSARSVGTLYAHATRGRETATFRYADDWLTSPDHFALEPALSISEAPHHTDRKLFGAIADSAPDRWGRTLIRRKELRNARAEGRTPRTLWEIDFLLEVMDAARPGALRFSKGGPFLAEERPGGVPPLIELPKLLHLTERYLEDEDLGDDFDLLFAPGSSLGGARPKASVRGADGRLRIAKFPRPDDEVRIVAWEGVALSLAAKAGIQVEGFDLRRIDGRDVLLIERFDRRGAERIPLLSAMSMLGAADGDEGNYLDIADSIRRHGIAVRSDLRELWRRIVFSILISNTDDHLRNHAFLFSDGGWVLSPSYDLNPVPIDIRPRFLSTAITPEGDNTCSLDLALSVAEFFDLGHREARDIAREVARAVSEWREVATNVGIAAHEIDRMASAFDDDELVLALA